MLSQAERQQVCCGGNPGDGSPDALRAALARELEILVDIWLACFGWFEKEHAEAALTDVLRLKRELNWNVDIPSTELPKVCSCMKQFVGDDPDRRGQAWPRPTSPHHCS